MNRRETIRHAIRKALAGSGDDAMRRATVERRLSETPRGIVPERGQVSPEEQVALFMQMLDKASATTERVDDTGDIPRSVARFLREHNLPARLRTGDDKALADLIWDGTQIEVDKGPAEDADAVSLSRAETAIAEAGTLVLTSGPDNPTTLNFMPDVHIVTISAADITGDIESAWARLRDKFGKGILPRTVNFIAGPSRSGDIQQKILLGAHGPRRLHVIVVG